MLPRKALKEYLSTTLKDGIPIRAILRAADAVRSRDEFFRVYKNGSLSDDSAAPPVAPVLLLDPYEDQGRMLDRIVMARIEWADDRL
jgi:hypothetical protein